MFKVRLAHLIALVALVACVHEESVNPSSRASGRVDKVNSLSQIVLPPVDPSSRGECVEIPADLLGGDWVHLRNVAYVMPEAKRMSRRIMIGLDTSGNVVRFNEFRPRLAIGAAHLNVDVDLIRNSGYVIGKATDSTGARAGVQWSASADAILDDPRLGSPRSMFELIRDRCLVASKQASR